MFVKISPNPTLTIGYFMNVKQSFLLKSKIFALLNYVLFRAKRKKTNKYTIYMYTDIKTFL